MPSDLNTDVTLPLDKTRNRPAAKAIESPQNLNCVFQKDNTVEPKMTPAAQVWKGLRGEYQVVSTFGEGGFATVTKAHNTETGDTVAIKHPRLEDYDERNKEKIKAFIQIEIALLRLLKHPSIIRLIDHDTDLSFFVMEAMELGPLDQENQRKRFSLREVETILYDILDALVLIHSHRLIHSDIKTANILVHKRNEKDIGVKLVDFGLTRREGDEVLIGGSREWCAPEMYSIARRFSNKIDLWSLGLLTLGFIWQLPQKPSTQRTVFDPESPFANGWDGAIRRAVEELRNFALTPGGAQRSASTSRGAAGGMGHEPRVELNETHILSGSLTGEMPSRELVLLIDELLQIEPDHRPCAVAALSKLQVAYKDKYFLPPDSRFEPDSKSQPAQQLIFRPSRA